MKLSSAYLVKQLKKCCRILGIGGISGTELFGGPVLGPDKNQRGRVMILPAGSAQKQGNNFYLMTGLTDPEAGLSLNGPYILFDSEETPEHVFAETDRIYQEADEFEGKLMHDLLKEDELQEIIRSSAAFLGNPLYVIAPDLGMLAEAGTAGIPAGCQLFDGDNVKPSFMEMLLQYKNLEKELGEPTLYPAFIGGCRTIGVSLKVGERFSHRIVMTEVQPFEEDADFCILKMLVPVLTYILEHTPSILEKNGLESIFRTLLSDRTADYMQVSRHLARYGWNADQMYYCLVLRFPYQDQNAMTIPGICRTIHKLFPDSCAFEFENDVVVYFNLTRLDLKENEIGQKLSTFIRDSYLRAGYSRVIRGHMNLRRQYLQSVMAIEVGSRVKPQQWIYRFSQIVLTYILEQTTHTLSAEMLCHEGILELKKQDAEHHTEYMKTLRVYLDTNLSAARAASCLFIHRSTFLYRLDKIREILQSGLEDPDEIFYLNYSIRLLEMESKQEI